ncbi:MAG: serine/threonine-protein kinase [Polyangiaceae bacterium]
MNRRSFPSGQSSTLLPKALLRYLEANRGPAEADAWLKGLGLSRDELEDETRPIPLTSVHQAIKGFAQVTSRDAIADVWKYMVLPDVLGAWMRVLRGTSAPREAFAQLDASESEYGRTMRWETLDAGDDFWRGRMHVLHDPTLESDGLLSLGRVAELSAIPALFGYGRATFVTSKPVTVQSGTYHEFEARWRVPNVLQATLAAGAGFAATSVVPMLVLPTSPPAMLSAFVGAFGLGALVGAGWSRDKTRRAESAAQIARVHALERSILLKEDRERNAAGGNLEGTVIAGQYRIKRRMGSGASGVIYEAIRIADGLPVAIKLLRAAAAHDATASDRLRREAEALGLAWHPNVVEVIDHGHLPDGTSFLSMELLHGEPMSARLRTKGRLSPAELLPFALQMCDALAAVHAAGVVHRDVKPSNVFLSVDPAEPGAPVRVKLLDFGIARVEWEETRITNMGSPLGTPGYMAPEQETGGDVDARSDLFALGAVLYECLVGDAPPTGATSGVTRTSSAEYPAMPSRFDWTSSKVIAAIPPAWRVVIEKALAPSPEERYQDARSFALALKELMLPPSRTEAQS